MNMAIQQADNFSIFKELSHVDQENFKKSFLRIFRMEVTCVKTENKISMESRYAEILFRLLRLTWYEILNTRCKIPNFMFLGDPYATNQVYLPNNPGSVTNAEIMTFASECLFCAVFVANSFGCKNTCGTPCSAYVNLRYPDLLNAFCQKSTNLMSKRCSLINRDPWPPWMDDDTNESLNQNIPLVVGYDFGVELRNVDINKSLMINGITGRIWLKQALLSSKSLAKKHFLDKERVSDFGKYNAHIS